MNILPLGYTKMLKLELPTFARNVIDIIERHNPEQLKIKEIYDLLVAQMPYIELLKCPYGEHPLTKPKKHAHAMCLVSARELVYRMGMLVKLNAANPTKSLLYTSACVKQYLHRLDLSENETDMIGRVNGFFITLKNDEEMQKAFAEFGLSKQIEELDNARTVFSELKMKKTQMDSEQCQLKTKDIQAPIIKALKKMFTMIEVAAMIHPDIDYAPLFHFLNQTIREQQNTIRRRELYNKKKAEIKKAEASNKETASATMEKDKNAANKPNIEANSHIIAASNSKATLDIPIVAPSTTTNSNIVHMETIADKELKKEHDQQFNKKKVAAILTKQVQLKSLDEET